MACCCVWGSILRDEVGRRSVREAILLTVAMWETYISAAFFRPPKASPTFVPEALTATRQKIFLTLF